eukprot:TRINITY_DN67874_c0_g1_i1.p1 TRINITY_DN67874_c0_g1~~TRINITY_DN67874_c0_g1_i1.p1  ORF type:complete len:234 (+),score=33.67 TRINITY_DN67874_c0_g1_i1:30-731(+)
MATLHTALAATARCGHTVMRHALCSAHIRKVASAPGVCTDGYYPPPDLSRLATADLADYFIGDVDSLTPARHPAVVSQRPLVQALLPDPVFRDFGGQKSFSGRIATVQCFESNLAVRGMLSEAGEGRVLVVDAGASARAAVLGDNLAELAIKNGWAGVLLHGYLRDAACLASMPLGIKALGTYPVKSGKRSWSVQNQPVKIAGVVIRPGDYIYCDEDGVLLSDSDLQSLLPAP